MKKLLLVFAVLLATVSSSFAYQETIYVSGPYGSSNSSSGSVYVNSFVGSITLSASWNSGSYDASGVVSAYAYAYGGSPSPYSDQYYYYTSQSSTYSKTVTFPGYGNQPYITSVAFWISAYSCSGQATVNVM